MLIFFKQSHKLTMLTCVYFQRAASLYFMRNAVHLMIYYNFFVVYKKMKPPSTDYFTYVKANVHN